MIANLSDPSYQICVRCVMDTTDPDISFDDDGMCSHCQMFDEVIAPQWHPGTPEGDRLLHAMVDEIKGQGRGQEYDCLIGLSGGVDSTYLAYQVKRLGLRPLAVHVDAGWNSELAVKNIENIVRVLGLDLHTHVIDWLEMRDLQHAYMLSEVANQDVPQDHAFTAVLLNEAKQHGIKYFLSGSNFATESILPLAWGYNAADSVNLKDIHRRFGKRPLRTYPTVSFFQYYVYYPRIFGLKKYQPLNYMDYRREAVIPIIEQELGWRNYGSKHHESRFTKYFQAHYLPTKFGYDKRRCHLASMVLSSQLTRDEALQDLNKPLYDPSQLEEDQRFVAKKLGFTMTEFEQLLQRPGRSFSDYKSQRRLFELKNKVRKLAGR